MWPAQRAEETPVSCAWAQERLPGYLDGDQAPRDLRRLRTHLEGCPACRRELAICRHTERLLSSALPSAPPAGDLRAGFYARLAASSAAARRPAWSGWLAAPLAVLLLCAYLFLRPHPAEHHAEIASLPKPLSAARAELHVPAMPVRASAQSQQNKTRMAARRQALAMRIAARLRRLPVRFASRRSQRFLIAGARRHSPFRMVSVVASWGPIHAKWAAALHRAEERAKQVALAEDRQLGTEVRQENVASARLLPASDEVDFSVRDDVRIPLSELLGSAIELVGVDDLNRHLRTSGGETPHGLSCARAWHHPSRV